jgi:hypothetical protein
MAQGGTAVSDNLALIIAERDKWIVEAERLRAELAAERLRREAAEAKAAELEEALRVEEECNWHSEYHTLLAETRRLEAALAAMTEDRDAWKRLVVAWRKHNTPDAYNARISEALRNMAESEAKSQGVQP